MRWEIVQHDLSNRPSKKKGKISSSEREKKSCQRGEKKRTTREGESRPKKK